MQSPSRSVSTGFSSGATSERSWPTGPERFGERACGSTGCQSSSRGTRTSPIGTHPCPRSGTRHCSRWGREWTSRQPTRRSCHPDGGRRRLRRQSSGMPPLAAERHPGARVSPMQGVEVSWLHGATQWGQASGLHGAMQRGEVSGLHGAESRPMQGARVGPWSFL